MIGITCKECVHTDYCQNSGKAEPNHNNCGIDYGYAFNHEKLIRYTTKNEDGSYDYDKHLVGEAMDLLGGYEDIGLSPEDVQDLHNVHNNVIKFIMDMKQIRNKYNLLLECYDKKQKECESWKRESISDKAKLGEVRIALKERKEVHLKRVPHYVEVEKIASKGVEDSENICIPTHPGAKMVDEKGREQFNQAIQKQNELLAKVEEIEAIQEEYFK